MNQAIREKPFPWKCGNCRQKAVVRVTTPYSIPVRYDGLLYEVNVPNLTVPKCGNCGSLMIDSAALKQMDDAQREQLGLLMPAEIRRHREALSLTQRQLADLLRVSEATLAHWESGGMFQPRGYDELLRNAFGLADIRAAVTGRNGVAPAAAEATAR